MDEGRLKSELRRFVGVYSKPVVCLGGTVIIGVRHHMFRSEIHDECFRKWEKDGIPEGVIESFLDADILSAIYLTKRYIRNFRTLSGPRQRACINLAFHGEGDPVKGFRSLKKAFAAIQKNLWVVAGEEVKKSQWAKICASPERVDHIAKLLLLDDRQEQE